MKKGQLILVCFTAAFICILLGLYIGRNANLPVPIQPSNSLVTSNSQTKGKININDATVSQLMQLPGIGNTIAQNIVNYRDENGPYKETDDLLNVVGIGEVRFKELLEYIYIPG